MAALCLPAVTLGHCDLSGFSPLHIHMGHVSFYPIALCRGVSWPILALVSDDYVPMPMMGVNKLVNVWSPCDSVRHLGREVAAQTSD